MSIKSLRPSVPFVAAAAAAAMILACAPPAAAQPKKDPKADAPITRTPDNLRAHPEPYPRLDPGAVLCDSAADLDQHFAVVDAQLNGTAGPLEPAGCRTIRSQVAISVLSRASPGRTQVKLSKEPGTVGWTDVFLPDKNPVKQKAANAAAPGF